jgi:lipopolysaccharide/colanic/teichoic acid biosynthesis glycosyltransferase
MLLVALAVRLEGGPGVLFRQERVGVDGQHFSLLKFRSLKPVDETESATNWNIAQDDRLGPVGVPAAQLDRRAPAAAEHPARAT